MQYGMGITTSDLDRGYNLLPSSEQMMQEGPGSTNLDPASMVGIGSIMPNMGGAGGEAGFLGDIMKLKGGDGESNVVDHMGQDEAFKEEEQQRMMQKMLQNFQQSADQHRMSPPYGQAVTRPVHPDQPQGRAVTKPVHPDQPRGNLVDRHNMPAVAQDRGNLVDRHNMPAGDYRQQIIPRHVPPGSYMQQPIPTQWSPGDYGMQLADDPGVDAAIGQMLGGF